MIDEGLTQLRQTTQKRMERCMLGITRRDTKRNTWVRKMTGVTDIIDKVRSLRWVLTGHVARRNDNGWTSAVMNWILRNVKRPRRRPKDRWNRDIIQYSGVAWQRGIIDRGLRTGIIGNRLERPTSDARLKTADGDNDNTIMAISLSPSF